MNAGNRLRDVEKAVDTEMGCCYLLLERLLQRPQRGRRCTKLTSRVINEQDECNIARIPVLRQEEGRPSLCTPRARRGQRRQATIVLGGDTERDSSASC